MKLLSLGLSGIWMAEKTTRKWAASGLLQLVGFRLVFGFSKFGFSKFRFQMFNAAVADFDEELRLRACHSLPAQPGLAAL